MKVIRTGEFKEGVLERLVEINTLEEAKDRFKRLNLLLSFVKERYPETFQEYIDNLRAKYEDLLEDERRKAHPVELNDIVSENRNMSEQIELSRLALNYFLQVLQVPAESSMGKATVVNKNYFQSWSHLSYYSLLVLTETIGRTEAITLYKRFVTRYFYEKRNPNRKTYDNLETFFARVTEPQETPSDWVTVHTMLADGKYASRRDNCIFIQSQDDLPDSELKYYISCYGDFERAKDYHNSVVLTMEHTIAQGDPYCSRLYHDTRVDWDLRHPPKSFWDSMEPENE
jgi:hypothetical protein